MIEELNNYYDEIKGVLEVLPVNNKHNISKKVVYITEEIQKDEEKINCVKKEIESRISKFDLLKENENINKYLVEIEKCNIVNEWNYYNTSYEKMRLDYYLYQLQRYYKEDLEGVNNCIRKILESFKKVNIDITKEDFTFNSSAAEYMDKIINNSQEEELKTMFEDIYWKNSDIIKIIEINFKSIYLRNEKKINKYYEKRHEDFLKNHNDSEIYDIRIKLNEQYQIVKETDPYLNFQKFLNGEYLLSDYKTVEIDKKKSIFFEENSYTFEKVKELYRVLNEYNIIIKYKYLFDNMKEKLNTKDTLKNSKSNALKELSKIDNELKKLNISGSKKSLFGHKKTDDKLLFKYKEALKNAITKYDEFDDACFNDLVFQKLTQDSTIYDVLKLIVSNYIYFVKKTLEFDDTLSISSITDKFKELNDYIYNNDFILLDSIALLDEKQMKELIVNKYNLGNINLTTDLLVNDNIDKTISDIKTIINYEYLTMSKINVDDISLYLDYKKIS